MSEDYFNIMRADFLEQFGSGLCEESIEQVKNAKYLGEFIALIHHYAHFLCRQRMTVPTVEWVRKWLSDYKEEANAHGVYIDQIKAIKDPQTDGVVLFGICNVTAVLTDTRVFEFVLEDSSCLQLIANEATSCTVRLKSSKTNVKVVYQSNYSRIKIRKAWQDQ